MILESVKHASSVFVTLTYASEFLPPDASLVPRHAQLWLKRIRKRAGGKLRFFLCGEYGTESFRPHYHVILFGLEHQLCIACKHQYKRQRCDCMVSQSWKMGHVFIGDVTKDSAAYVAGYVVKKMTQVTDKLMKQPCLYDSTCKDKFCMRKKIMQPEFARMSLRPGIGAPAMVDVAAVLTTEHGADFIVATGDVPAALSHGKRSLPLGRYLRSKLREEVGLDEALCKENNARRWALEMRELLAPEVAKPENAQKSLSRIVSDLNEQKARSQEARYKIYSRKKGSL